MNFFFIGIIKMDRLCTLIIAEISLVVFQASLDQTGRCKVTAKNSLKDGVFVRFLLNLSVYYGKYNKKEGMSAF